MKTCESRVYTSVSYVKNHAKGVDWSQNVNILNFWPKQAILSNLLTSDKISKIKIILQFDIIKPSFVVNFQIFFWSNNQDIKSVNLKKI